MLVILATAMLFVTTLMIHSHAPVKIATQEMDSLVKVIQLAVMDPCSGSHEPPAPSNLDVMQSLGFLEHTLEMFLL